MCVSSVFALTTECSSLTVNLVVTLRKFVSLLLSVAYFDNSFTALHWIATFLVFAGTLLFTDVFSAHLGCVASADARRGVSCVSAGSDEAVVATNSITRSIMRLQTADHDAADKECLEDARCSHTDVLVANDASRANGKANNTVADTVLTDAVSLHTTADGIMFNERSKSTDHLKSS